MQVKHEGGVSSLHAVLDFLDANADSLGALNETGTRKSLDAVVAELSEHISAQMSGTLAQQAATRKKNDLREALMRDYVRPIARIAKAALPDSPEVKSLRMPRQRLSAPNLAAHAAGMAQAAGPFADVFVASGMPVEFIARLTAASNAMVAALDERSSHAAAVRGATVGIPTALRRGRTLVHVLDAMVKSAVKDDRVLLAMWQQIMRIPRPRGA